VTAFKDGHGFPLTVLQSRSLHQGAALSSRFKPCSRCGDVYTLEDLADFRAYMDALKAPATSEELDL